MNKLINIKNRREAAILLLQFKEKKYFHQTIRFSNVNLRKINSFLAFKVFVKNDLYADSETLYELMQPEGEKGVHNYHDLSPDLLLDALNSIVEPYCVFVEDDNRYAVITMVLVDGKEPLMAIIAVGSGTYEDTGANVNKLVTMFPKKNIESFISNLEESKILYKNDFILIKKWEPIRGANPHNPHSLPPAYVPP